MTISTAFIDIFVWAPMFAFLATFETCSGGGIFSRQPRVCTSDYMKGIGRLFVSCYVAVDVEMKRDWSNNITCHLCPIFNGWSLSQVSVQSMATGVFYLVTAVVSWSAFADSRDSKVRFRSMKCMHNTRFYRSCFYVLFPPLSHVHPHRLCFVVDFWIDCNKECRGVG